MPIPIVGWAVIALGTAVAGYLAKNFFEDDEPENKKFEYGSTILIGTQSSGKTKLANWINNNQLSDEYKPTMNNITIGNFLDLPGYEHKKHEWENLIKEKENIFYLFDMERFFNKQKYVESTYDDIVIKHISFFTEYLIKKGSMENKKLIVIGTHLDKINEENAQFIINTLHKEEILNSAKIVYGSLLNRENIQKLEKNIIDILEG